MVIGGAFSVRTPRIVPNPLDYEVSGIWRAENASKLITSKGKILYEREDGEYYNGRVWNIDATFFIAEEYVKEAEGIDRQTFSVVYPMSLAPDSPAWNWLKKFELEPGGALTMEEYEVKKAQGQGVIKLSYKVPWRESINEVLYVKAVGTDELAYVEAGIDWRIPIGKRVNLVPLLSYYYEPADGLEPSKESVQAKLTIEFDVLKLGKKENDD